MNLAGLLRPAVAQGSLRCPRCKQFLDLGFNFGEIQHGVAACPTLQHTFCIMYMYMSYK